MALYNNREVTVFGPTYMQSLPETVRIGYPDNTQETVAVSQVYFTEDERKALVKAYPSRFDSVHLIPKPEVEK